MVSFVTQCYHGDYKNVLDNQRLQKNIENNNYNFNEKIVIINISKNEKEIIDICENLVKDNVLTGYYLVSDYLQDICNFFEIKKEYFCSEKSFHLNLYNLASIYLSKSEYIVFYTGDSICTEKSDWIEKSINMLRMQNNISTCLPWSSEPIIEHYREENDFYFSNVSFSDQNYMIKKSEMMTPEIVKHKSNKFFPHGDTFEMRVHGYIQKFGLNRLIYKYGRYEHKNF